MVHVIIIAHSEIARSFVAGVEHVFSKRLPNLHIIEVTKTEVIEESIDKLKSCIAKFANEGEEVLMLTDIFGATPSNIASQMVKKGKVELITGVNLPMLVRALSYSHLALPACIERALEGARNGIIYLNGEESHVQ